MGHNLTRPARAARGITAEDGMEILGQLTPRQQTDALLWLAGYAPDVFNAVANAVQPCCGDGSDDPAPFCATCGYRRVPQARPGLAALPGRLPGRY